MTDYTKEAERLLDDVVRAATMWDGHGVQADVAYRESRAALLAHIQRGAVPEALDPEFLIGYLEEREDWRGREVLIERIRQAAAPAPDQFRDAAKMMATTAEVPNADQLWNNDEVMALNAELGLTLDQMLRLVRAALRGEVK